MAAPALGRGAPGWTAPTTIPSPTGNIDLAVDHDGKAIVLATSYGTAATSVQSFVHPVSPDGWQEQPIGSYACGGYCNVAYSQPVIGMSLDGTAYGLWSFGGPSQGNIAPQAALRPSGSAWSPIAFADEPAWNFQNRIAVGPTGTVLMVSQCLYCDMDGMPHVAARALTPAGFGARQLISPAEYPDTPQAGVDAAGRATAAWSSGLGVRVVTRGLGGVWSAPQTLGAGGGQVLAVNAAGSAELVWRGSDGKLKAARRTGPEGAWAVNPSVATGAAVPTEGSGLGAGSVALDDGDKAVATWTGSDGVVRAGVQPLGGPWTVTPISAGSDAHVALNPAGTAFLAYTGPTGAVLVSTRPAGGSWSAPQPLSAAGSTSPRVAADANGNAVVAWIAATGVLQAAAYDATGPVLPGPAIPSTATVGQAVGVSIAPPWDLWSSVASVGWDFGDGTTAAGPSATHAWSQPGTYTVTVSGSDTFGNSTSRSGQITVTPQPPAQAAVSIPVPTPSRGPSGPAVGTMGTVAGVTARLPGASAAKTPLPTKLSKAALRKLPRLRVSVGVPKRIKKRTKIIISLRLNRPVRGALATVQLRRGVSYRTIARGRVSGRRIPVALSFRSAGRYLLRVRVQEARKGTVTKVVAISVR
jgi:hypothetical protein